MAYNRSTSLHFDVITVAPLAEVSYLISTDTGDAGERMSDRGNNQKRGICLILLRKAFQGKEIESNPWPFWTGGVRSIECQIDQRLHSDHRTFG